MMARGNAIGDIQSAKEQAIAADIKSNLVYQN